MCQNYIKYQCYLLKKMIFFINYSFAHFPLSASLPLPSLITVFSTNCII